MPQLHFDSLAHSRQLSPAKRYLVVDDVITRGATLLACASRIKESNPTAEVKGFALLRAISNPVEFEAIVDPVGDGTITLRPQGDTLRRP
jgi:hypoxanthine phosphoribosyltransferase